ncbi:hypothetical protein C5167_027049 [Papaver somniferum]|nr:hypothetical protein C5167_027049 [Papaver somniferum]
MSAFGSTEGRVGVHHLDLDDSQQEKNFTFKCIEFLLRLKQRWVELKMD